MKKKKKGMPIGPPPPNKGFSPGVNFGINIGVTSHIIFSQPPSPEDFGHIIDIRFQVTAVYMEGPLGADAAVVYIRSGG